MGDETRSDDDDNIVRVDFARRGAQTKREIPRAQVSAHVEAASRSEGESLLFDMFQKWIELGVVQVTLDARRDDVRVPTQFKDASDLCLNFSRRYGIADFAYDAQGVRASLSFAGRPSWCDVPWRAVWMLSSHVTNETLLAPREHVPDDRRHVFDQLVESIEGIARGRVPPTGAAAGGDDDDDEPRKAVRFSDAGGIADDGDVPGAGAADADASDGSSDDPQPEPPSPAGGGPRGLRLVKG